MIDERGAAGLHRRLRRLHHVRRRRGRVDGGAASTTRAAWRVCADELGGSIEVDVLARGAGHAGRAAARPRGHGHREGRGMRFVDEFRDPELGGALAARDPAHRRARPPLQDHGGLRRAHALDLQVRRRRPAAGQRRARPRPRLPGVRDPDGPRRRRHRDRPRARRDLHLLRRHAARARRRRHPAGRQGAGRRRADGLLAARRAAHRQARTPTARSCSSPSASRRRRRRPR